MKKVVWSIIVFLFCICEVKAFNGVSAEGIYFYNLSEDKAFYEENSDKKTSVASLTKITTAIVAIEHITNLDEEFILTGDDFYGTTGLSLAGFKVGDHVTYRDLLYGLLLPSGAECAKTLASLLFLNSEDMVNEMNNFVTRLGLQNTHYTNIIGVDDENHYSTPEDVAAILKYALQNKTFYEIFTSREYTASNGLVLKSTLESSSKDLDLNLDYILGSKTGFTSDAGRCLASLATHNNENYILVITNSNLNSLTSHIIDTDKLYNEFFNNYSYRPIIAKGDVITTIKTYNNKEVEFLAKQDYKYFLKNDEEYKIVFDGEKVLHKDVKVGDKVGKFTIVIDGEEIYSEDLFLEKSISNNILQTILLVILSLVVLLFLIREYNIWKRKLKRRRRKLKYEN